MKQIIKLFRDLFVDKYFTKIYSQDGEDLLALRFFSSMQSGFYLDIGAHHPKRFSNTYLLYKKGWRGINIDAMPGSMIPFNLYRPKDINIEIAIGKNEETKTFFIFNEPALNTFDANLAIERTKNPAYKIVQKAEIKICPLTKILKQYLPANQKIDFLTIDVEGLDLEILKTNDWVTYRPTLVCVEIYAESINDVLKSDLNNFLSMNKYEFIYRAGNSCFFKATSL